MKGYVKFTLGGAEYQLEIEERDDMETLHKLAVLGNPRRYCDECKNTEHFKLDSNKDKEGNIYVNVVCRKCGAKSKLGQYKAGGYFWREFEKYVKPGETAATPMVQARKDRVDEIDLDKMRPGDGEELPF